MRSPQIHWSALGWRGVLAASILFALLVVAFMVWLFRPYPSVTFSEPPIRVEDGTPPGDYEAGEALTWIREEICIPTGVTTVQFIATNKFAGGSIDTTLITKRFSIPQGACLKKSPTSIIIPEDLDNGEYALRLEVCTQNPTPRDECRTATGPTFHVVGQSAGLEPTY